MGATTSVEGVSLKQTEPKIPSRHCRNRLAMADTSFLVLSSPIPNSALRPRGNESDNLDTSSNRRHRIDSPQCLVHAEHEILIFLYFQIGESWQNAVIPYRHLRPV
jgi:hypothetical protein